MLGNGLRVVAGTILASGGEIMVYTRNKSIEVIPQEDRSTRTVTEPTDHPIGTRIEIKFGPRLRADRVALSWARGVLEFGHAGTACCRADQVPCGSGIPSTQ